MEDGWSEKTWTGHRRTKDGDQVDYSHTRIDADYLIAASRQWAGQCQEAMTSIPPVTKDTWWFAVKRNDVRHQLTSKNMTHAVVRDLMIYDGYRCLVQLV